MESSENWNEPRNLDEYIRETSKTVNFGTDISVFISSTVEDLKEERDAISDLIRDIGLTLIRMEDFSPSDSTPLEVCLDKVSQATIYLGIIGSRYGTPYEPDNPTDIRKGKSFTELEYDHAKTQGLRRCVILIDETKAKVHPVHVDRGPNNELASFRKKLERDCFVKYYTDLESLRKNVYDGLLNLVKEIRTEEIENNPKTKDTSASITVGLSGIGKYYASECIEASGVSSDCDQQHVYLYLLKNDEETKSALQQGKFPPEEKIYTLYRYGEPYLKIPVDSKTSVWQAKLPLASLTPRIKDEQSLTLCVTENPIHSSQDLGAHATVSFTVLPPFSVLMCSSTTIKQNETLFIRGRVMTPQPLIHFWMFSEKNELFTHQAIIQPDETFELALTPEITKEYSQDTQYYCVAQVPWDSRWGRVRIQNIKGKKYIVKINDSGYSDLDSAIGIGDQTQPGELRDLFIKLLDQTEDQYLKFTLTTS